MHVIVYLLFIMVLVCEPLVRNGSLSEARDMICELKWKGGS
ncbi:hypothetical protein [Photobacterium kishitanii]|nr:hypothetical protein [Photobacterium kishitanii]